MGAFNLLGESSEEPSLEPFEEQGEDTSTVTHTGVRVVYPDENAALFPKCDQGNCRDPGNHYP